MGSDLRDPKMMVPETSSRASVEARPDCAEIGTTPPGARRSLPRVCQMSTGPESGTGTANPPARQPVHSRQTSAVRLSGGPRHPGYVRSASSRDNCRNHAPGEPRFPLRWKNGAGQVENWLERRRQKVWLNGKNGEELVPTQKFYLHVADGNRIGIARRAVEKPVFSEYGVGAQIRQFGHIAAAALQTHTTRPDAVYPVRRITQPVDQLDVGKLPVGHARYARPIVLPPTTTNTRIPRITQALIHFSRVYAPGINNRANPLTNRRTLAPGART